MGGWVVGGVSQCPPAHAARGLWHAVSRAPADAAARDIHKARAEGAAVARKAGAGHVSRNGPVAGSAELHLRRALRSSTNDFEARRQLAELLSATGRHRDAARAFDEARRVAPTPVDESRIWFRLANERSRVGAYAEALDAYSRQLAIGDADPAALGNCAELLMALGRLPEAIERYREALAIEEREHDRRGHLQSVALGYFGLAVALDRHGREAAAREAMGRALVLDAGLGVLRLAQQDDGDLFLLPAGDVFYYLGLAREAQGRTGDATAAFADYLRVPAARYANRAREHMARLGQSRASPVAARGTKLRVVHEATLVADGPLVAPLIDAAWRLNRELLDDCLSDVVLLGGSSDVAPARSARAFRISLELTFDETGRVGAVKADPPAELGPAVGPCIENAVRTRFQVTRPARRKPTRARMELVLAPAGPSG